MSSKKKPIEVWALVLDDEDAVTNFPFIGPALDDDGTNSFLAFLSKEEAEKGAEFQRDFYGCQCHPVRIA